MLRNNSSIHMSRVMTLPKVGVNMTEAVVVKWRIRVGVFRRMFVPDDNDQPVLATEFFITLVFDHRIVDGAPAAEFLRTFKEYAEALELLV